MASSNGASAAAGMAEQPMTDAANSLATAQFSSLTEAIRENEDAKEASNTEQKALAPEKWPGWPGYSVFRLIVAVTKVGSIIGRKGELVKKMCDETRARIRILEAPSGTTDRVVLISGKEEPESPLPPAIDAAIRVFKRVSGLSLTEGEGNSSVSGAAFCSLRLLVASSQAINLIGKQGSTIKSIQETTSASVRVLPEEELPAYAASDERIVEVHGEALKVLSALEAVLGQLRKFLVDQSVIPVFEKNFNEKISQERAVDVRAEQTQPSFHAAPHQISVSDYSLSLKRDPLLDRETHLEAKLQPPGLPIYAHDHGLSSIHSSGLSRSSAPIVTQVTKMMQVPLSYAEDIIGVGGLNIGYIRRTSGAILTIQESGALPDEITVEIKGSSSQVQMAEQLIQEFVSRHKEPTPSMYSKVESDLSSYSQLPETTYSSSAYASHLGAYGSSGVGGYGSSGLGGYSSFRY